MARIRVVVFGDSIAWGRIDNECGGWVNRLQAKYAHLDADKEIQFYNLGIPGGRLKDTLERIKVEFEARQPAHVVLAVGVNDAFDGMKTDQFTGLFEQILAQLGGKEVSIIGLIQPSPTHPEAKQASEQLTSYDETLKQWAKIKGIQFIDVWGVLGNEDYAAGHIIHPNAKGHAKLAKAIEAELIRDGVLK